MRLLTLAELVGGELAGEFARESDRQLRELLDRHRRSDGPSGDVAAPEDDDEEQDRRDEPGVGGQPLEGQGVVSFAGAGASWPRSTTSR